MGLLDGISALLVLIARPYISGTTSPFLEGEGLQSPFGSHHVDRSADCPASPSILALCYAMLCYPLEN